MNIEIKYNVGDKIQWRIGKQTEELEDCSFCNGIGQIQGHDNSILRCPKCNGFKKYPVLRYVDGESTVQGIVVSWSSFDAADPTIVYHTEKGGIPQNSIIGIVEEAVSEN